MLKKLLKLFEWQVDKEPLSWYNDEVQQVEKICKQVQQAMSYTFTDEDIAKYRPEWPRFIDLGISDPKMMLYYIESLESTVDNLNDTIDHLRNEISNLEEEIVCLKLGDLYNPNDR